MTHALESKIRSTGLRATRQRVALLSALESAPAPRAVEELAALSGGEYDLATAYRMLAAFETAGLARRIDLGQGRALFESASMHHHHHAVCRLCGAIRDVEACLPPGIDERVRKASGFASIDEHALEFFGICARCAA
jgi:Fur family ferric uptake transcriptional regulator